MFLSKQKERITEGRIDLGVSSRLPRAQLYGPRGGGGGGGGRGSQPSSSELELFPSSAGTKTEKAISGSFVVLGLRIEVLLAGCPQSHTEADTASLPQPTNTSTASTALGRAGCALRLGLCHTESRINTTHLKLIPEGKDAADHLSHAPDVMPSPPQYPKLRLG